MHARGVYEFEMRMRTATKALVRTACPATSTSVSDSKLTQTGSGLGNVLGEEASLKGHPLLLSHRCVHNRNYF